MIKRILTICAALVAGAAGTSLAHAQGYPVSPPGAVYSPAPQAYPPGGYPADYRRGLVPARPNFDSLEDDEAPTRRTRRRCLRPDRCFRRMTRVTRIPKGPGDLFRPRRADRPDHVAR